FTGKIQGSGGVTVSGGIQTLSGANTYTGATTVSGGTLLVNGGQSLATGAVSVASGATLGGSGLIGGAVTVADGGILAGQAGQVLTMPSLTLGPNANTNILLGAPNGGALFQVNGDLALGGRVNIGDMGPLLPGLYRIFDYTGIRSGSLAVGSLPAGMDPTGIFIQTGIDHQVNLFNAANGMELRVWNGAATGPGSILGGTGTWSAVSQTWSDPAATLLDHMGPAPGFAVFQTNPGVVTVDDGDGQVAVSGMQFAVSGYRVQGGAIQLADPSGMAIIRVGDATPAGAQMVATIASALTGSNALNKTDFGTLVLTGANTYGGGTTISGGTLQLGDGGTSGSIMGNVLNNGTLAFNRSDTVTFGGAISGSGAVVQMSAGTLILTGNNSYAGLTTISQGTLQIGDGGTSGGIQGNVLNNGTLVFNRSDAAIVPGAISGSGALRQEGSGTTILTGENTYTGGTTISAGTLQIGNGGTTGSIIGNVLNNSLHSLVFNRSDVMAFAGVISGIGEVRQEGTGTTILSGANTYSGPTLVNTGSLQAGAANSFSPNSAVSVAAGATLDLAGFDQGVAGLSNAGLVSLRGAVPGTSLTVSGNYVGQGGVIALNTVLAGDGAASDRLVISGGSATGDTRLRIVNVGGAGAQTRADGIRVVQAINGGTTAAGAFRLDTRVAVGAFEYQLFRGGSASADDWYLRSFLTASEGGDGGGDAVPPAIPLYRPEVALYAPIAAIGRQMGLATLGTLHERVGEAENIRDLQSDSPYANGGWARSIGERSRNRWDGTVEARATGDLFGMQAGFDIIRTRSYAGGHRDIAGAYVAYTNYNAPSVSGFALGQRGSQVGRLSLEGPSAGLYWTHFGPSGWYVDAVLQANWFDVKARSDYRTALSTNGTGYAASLEAGYPIRFGQGGAWQIEPQA
ncbi:MAG TPA: autotransporter outer membrane beta-barrel domain-containing protein, partial [Roseomonas sp.]